MVSEVVLSAEGLPADVARVGPLVGVGTLVDQQIVRLGELSVAVFADELLLGPGAGRAGRSERRRVAAGHSLCHSARVPQGVVVERGVSDPLVEDHGLVRRGRLQSGDLRLHVGLHGGMRVGLRWHWELLIGCVHDWARVGRVGQRPGARLVAGDHHRGGGVVRGGVRGGREGRGRTLQLHQRLDREVRRVT